MPHRAKRSDHRSACPSARPHPGHSQPDGVLARARPTRPELAEL